MKPLEFHNLRALCLFAMASLLLTGVAQVLAQESNVVYFRQGSTDSGASLGFRIDVDVYADESNPPIAQFKTLFTDTKTLEVDSQGERVTILDHTDGTLSVLNTRSRTLTVIELADLDAMVQEIIAQPNANHKAAQPRRDSSYLFLADSSIEYKVRSEKPSVPVMAVRYADFADATTKLLAVFPPYRPPQLRLQLNGLLRQSRELPMSTTRTIKANNAAESITARLLIKPDFDDKDRRELQIVASQQEQFKLVVADTFFGTK